MTERVRNICGFGSKDGDLSLDDLTGIVAEALTNIPPGSRVLAVIPDKTRDDNTHILFPIAAKLLADRQVSKLDVLIAQGTHAAMNTPEKLAKIGVRDLSELPIGCDIFDHEWNVADELISIGTLSAAEVRAITDGLLDHSIDLTINKRISSDHYDHILVFGATSPHEVAGFSGGAKYFFPGVSGAGLTNASHWLGALAGIENTIGRIETPMRRMIETAADRIQPVVTCFTSVCSRGEKDKLATHALFGGDLRLSIRAAAAVSRDVHVTYVPRRYKRVVAILDEHYDELWTGGKASYKLGGIIEDGGELIILAPHLRCASDTHGKMIEEYGYAPIERVKQLVAADADLRADLCVAAHLAHVAYAGTNASAGLEPRYRISLVSQIDEETCGRLNLQYLAPQDLDMAVLENDSDTLIVRRAGTKLYLLSDEVLPV